jgi:hypothetical protein
MLKDHGEITKENQKRKKKSRSKMIVGVKWIEGKIEIICRHNLKRDS